MFNGLKSLLFGSAEEAPEARAEIENSLASQLPSPNRLNETSALLEQTLSLATSKLQEQLILPTSSIDKLNSFSRQELPSFIEQQQKQKEDNDKKLRESLKVDVELDDDDDSFNDDAWELLDYAENENTKVSISELKNNKPKDKKVNSPEAVCLKPAISDSGKKDVIGGKKKHSHRREKKAKKKEVLEDICGNASGCFVSKTDCNQEVKVRYVYEKQKSVDEFSPVPVPVESKAISLMLNYAAAAAKNIEEKAFESTKKISSGIKRNRQVSSSSLSSEETDSNAVDVVFTEKSATVLTFPTINEASVEKGSTSASADTGKDISSDLSDGEDCWDWIYDKKFTAVSKMNSKEYKSAKRTTMMAMANRLVESGKKKPGKEKSKSKPKRRKSSAKSESGEPALLSKPLSHISTSEFRNSKETILENLNVGPAKTLLPNDPKESSEDEWDEYAAMQDSWFVTPPPCFTGAQTFEKTQRKEHKAKVGHSKTSQKKIFASTAVVTFEASRRSLAQEAKANLERSAFVSEKKSNSSATTTAESDNNINRSSTEFENLLIEHPSLYIGSSRKASLAAPETSSTASESPVPVCDSNLSEVSDEVCAVRRVVGSKAASGKTVAGAKSAKVIAVTKKSKKNKTERDAFDDFDFSSDDDDDLWNDFSCPALISNSPVPMLKESGQPVDERPSDDDENDENIEPLKQAVAVLTKKTTKPKQIVQVKPIEPERQPGWQLRKKRLNRKSRSFSNSKGSYRKLEAAAMVASKQGEPSSSRQSPAPSTSTGSGCTALFERINYTLVSNLSSLASNLTPPMPQFSNPAVEEASRLEASANRAVMAKAALSPVGQRLNKSYMTRQNKVTALNGSNKHPSRQAKMHANFNGVSFDRKVHTNFK